MSRFQVDQANIERMMELFSFIRKLSQQGKVSGSKTKVDEKGNGLKEARSIDDLYKALQSGETGGFNEEMSKNLINLIERSAEYKTRENSLNNRIKALEKELNEKGSNLSTIVDFSSIPKDGETYADLQDKIKKLNEESEIMQKNLESQYKKDLSKATSELKEKVRKFEYELEKKVEEIQGLQGEISKLKAKDQEAKAPAKEEVFNSEYYIKMLKQIEENYAEKSKSIDENNHKNEQEVNIII